MGDISEISERNPLGIYIQNQMLMSTNKN
jgi:hypothetical protein